MDVEWNIGDRVWVPRISQDMNVILTIHDWCAKSGKPVGDDEDAPVVSLLFRRWEGNKLREQRFRYCKFDELEPMPRKIVYGGPQARRLEGLPPVHCGCGCGSETSGAEFKQGHDMKLKSRLWKAARAGDQQAVDELVKRGWPAQAERVGFLRDT